MRTSGRLRSYFFDNPGRLIHKWMHYFAIYESHFDRYRRKRVTVLEIGVFQGGSLEMWRKYFGRRVNLIGIDVNPRAKSLEAKNTRIFIGDQADREFLRTVVAEIGLIDIVIDDGGHTMEQQIVSFEELWPAVRPGGIYLVEDLHTSYWEEFGGGHRRSGTFIEYVKGLIDTMHAWHARPGDGLEVGDLTRAITGMHVYDSIVVLDKGKVTRPFDQMTGEPSFPLAEG